MGKLDRLRALFSKPVVAEVNPWAEDKPVAAVTVVGNPWKSEKALVNPRAEAPVNLWKTPAKIGKNWVLHKASFAVILVNILLALFFTSNNPQFNAALYTYLGASTILLGHYWGMTRG